VLLDLAHKETQVVLALLAQQVLLAQLAHKVAQVPQAVQAQQVPLVPKVLLDQADRLDNLVLADQQEQPVQLVNKVLLVLLVT
jgi:hypothetical protein